MAKIVHSDAAPSEAVHYSIGGAEFDLGGRNAKSFETTDASVISGASVHPWLRVEYDVVEPIQGAYVEQVPAKDDPMSAMNSIANDPDEVRKAEAAKTGAVISPVAIDSGEKQTEVITTGPVAETLAADDSSKTTEKGKE